MAIICTQCGLPSAVITKVQTFNKKGRVTLFLCPNCVISRYPPNFKTQHQSRPTMPPYKKQTARLIYEPSLQGYSLSFTYNEAIVEFVKKAIPSHKRTYDPASRTWYFGSEYFDIVRTLFDGHRNYTLAIVTQAEVEQKIREAEEASQHSWAPAQYSMGDLLQKFRDLLLKANIIQVDPPLTPMKVIENWTKEEATRFYKKAARKLHPDLNNGQDVGMSDLTSTWSILKESFYTK